MVNIVNESPDEGSLNKVCVYVFMYVICKSHTARVRITKDHRFRLFKLVSLGVYGLNFTDTTKRPPNSMSLSVF